MCSQLWLLEELGEVNTTLGTDDTRIIFYLLVGLMWIVFCLVLSALILGHHLALCITSLGLVTGGHFRVVELAHLGLLFWLK